MKKSENLVELKKEGAVSTAPFALGSLAKEPLAVGPLAVEPLGSASLDLAPLALGGITPELYVTQLKNSLSFYVEKLGFEIVYERPEDGFAMICFQGRRLMLEEITPESTWLSGKMERPFGRGVNFQIEIKEVTRLYERVADLGVGEKFCSIFLPLEEKSYRTGLDSVSLRQFIIADPDGYLLRFVEKNP